ncbi:patatin-like phospholipase family protein [candidate division KSB1 bacterium]|nr:patatin-like phospholipase family protein [candidate division KSB1 bacterium]
MIRTAASMLLLATLAYAQSRPKVGLALSGGGAKGFAHIGVLKVLEEVRMPIDCIAGTSMGSIIGALYAIGYDAKALEQIALHTEWQAVFSDDTPRRDLAMQEKIWDERYMLSFPMQSKRIKLPTGLSAGQRISAMIARLTWPAHHIQDFTLFPIPYACVATDLANGEAVTLTHGFLPEALRASMAIPTAFTPVKFQNRLLVDGGLVRNFPVEDARRLGADIVIGVDVGSKLEAPDSLDSFLKIMRQTIGFLEAASQKKQQQLCDILLQPNLGEVGTFSFDRVSEAIAHGENIARAHLPQLRALADSLSLMAPPARRSRIAQVDSIYIHAVEIAGLHEVSQRLIFAELQLSVPKWVSAKELEQAMTRLYTTHFFERVTYRLAPSEKGTTLIVQVLEKTAEYFHTGLRYDRDTKAALLVGATFRNLAEHGSNLVLETRLGQEIQFDAQYYIHTGFLPRTGLRMRLNHQRNSLFYYEAGRRISSWRYNTTSAEVFHGTLFSNVLNAGIGVKKEYGRFSPDIAQQAFPTITQNYLSAFVMMSVDNLNRYLFPARGNVLEIRSETADDRFASTVTFTRHALKWQGFAPLHPQWSLLSAAELGAAWGAGLPQHRQFFLGGADSFWGLRLQERVGKKVWQGMVGLQYEAWPKRYLLARFNIGNASNRTKELTKWKQLATGLAFTFGGITPLGPIEFTLAHGKSHNLLTYFNLGYKF